MPQENEPEPATTGSGAKIWLDKPATHLALGFDGIADSLADIIRESDTFFAIGIFGGWGSGKTTLMQAIQKSLESSSKQESPESGSKQKGPGEKIFICVSFNAWRFEREPALLVPLLDTIRGELAKWAKDTGADKGTKEAARRMGRIVRRLAAGASVEVGVPGTVKMRYDLDKGLSAWGAGRRDKPQSLYVATFDELSKAIGKLDKAIRVVVFVDDLDRCLELNALEVLESMKLFFDLHGFIFVAGLDERVIQRAVRARLAGSGHATAEPSAGGVDLSVTARPEAEQDYLEKSEREYLDKIFQVFYRLPQATTRELGELLTEMRKDASGALEDSPLVEKYLKYIAVNDRINPRAVKRFLNVYNVRMHTTAKKRELKEAILALQVLEFRYEWQRLNEEIRSDWRFFKEALKKFRTGDHSAFEDLSGDLKALPGDLARFLHSDEAKILADKDINIGLLLSSPDAEASDAPWLGAAYRRLWKLRDEVRRILRASPLEVSDRNRLIRIAKVFYIGTNPSVIHGSTFGTDMQNLKKRLEELKKIEPPGTQSDSAPKDNFRRPIVDITEEIFTIVERIRDELRAIAGSAVPVAGPVSGPVPVAVAAPEPVGPPDRGGYAAKVMGIVGGTLPHGWRLDREVREVKDSGHRFDGLIRSDTKTIAVEAVYNPRFYGGQVSRAISRAHSSEEARVDAALIVAASRAAPGFRRLEGDLTDLNLPHQVLEWQPEQDDDLILIGAVRELIQTLQRNGQG